MAMATGNAPGGSGLVPAKVHMQQVIEQPHGVCPSCPLRNVQIAGVIWEQWNHRAVVLALNLRREDKTPENMTSRSWPIGPSKSGLLACSFVHSLVDLTRQAYPLHTKKCARW